MSPTTSILTDLARSILDNATIVEAHLKKNNLPMMSFEEDAPDYPFFDDVEAEKARVASASACQDLYDLMLGPTGVLKPMLSAASLQYIHMHKLYSQVPLHGSITYDELASKTGLQAEKLRRLIRYGISHHRIFHEKVEGVVSHSAASRQLATSEAAKGHLGFVHDEIYQAYGKTVEALDRDENHESNASGWSIAHADGKTLWEHHAAHPELSEQVSQAMIALSTSYGHDLHSLLHGYAAEWTTIAARQGTVVDIGGATGYASIALARQYAGLQCIVQDVPQVIAAAPEPPADMAGRVSFIEHDLRDPQPIVGADVYLFRQVLHDWRDAECVAGLRALVPALKLGARVVVHDIAVPPPGRLAVLAERHVRHMDLTMLTLFNAKEREIEGWRALFVEADPRFVGFRVIQSEVSPLAIVEVTWSG